MNKFLSLSKRNIKIFFAEKSNIFFATLAVLILVALHFIVFRKMNADSMVNTFLQMGSKIDGKWALWLSDTLMLSAIIPIGAVSASLTGLSQIVADKEKNSINDFYVTPLNRNTLLLSYLFSSFVVGAIICGAFILASEIFFLAVYGISFTLLQLVAIIGVTLLSLILGNSFVLLIVSFVQREQAMGAIGTILGTMLGFICGAYIPLSVLGDGIATVFTCLPFLPVTVLSRQAFLMNAASTPFTKDMLSGELGKIYSYEAYLGNSELSIGVLLAIVTGYIIVFTVALVFIFKKMRKKD